MQSWLHHFLPSCRLQAELLNQSISELVESFHQRGSLLTMLRRNFRMALSMVCRCISLCSFFFCSLLSSPLIVFYDRVCLRLQLLYPYRRNGDNIRSQIRTVMEVLNNDLFCEKLQSQLLSMIKQDEYGFGSQQGWQFQVASSLRALCMAGRFEFVCGVRFVDTFLICCRCIVSTLP